MSGDLVPAFVKKDLATDERQVLAAQITDLIATARDSVTDSSSGRARPAPEPQ